MAQLLELFAAKYDVVLIDSPPVLGLADAPSLAAVVDGVIFVIEADRGRRGALKAALKRLRAVNSVLLGAVLTKFDPAKSGNRYSDYYGYDYYRYEPGSKAGDEA
jgi:Mrp family chromosome partitioning ATPase